MPELAPHYYVKTSAPLRSSVISSPWVTTLRLRIDMCARPGCGQPPEHPVHLRPAGPDFGDAPIRAAGAGA
jgi:hypothetical protein